MKQSKKIFLLLILLSSTNFMNLRGLETLPFDIINLLLAIYFIVYSVFKNKSWHFKYFKSTTVFIKFFCLAFILSTITAYLDWNQEFLTTFIASRSVLWLSFGLFIINSKTTFNELKTAFSYFTWIYIILTLLVVLIPELKSQLIYFDEAQAFKIDELIFYGLIYTLIPFYINLDKITSKVKITKLDLMQFFLTFVIIFFSESRATLFSALIITIMAYAFNSKYNIFQKVLIVVLVSAVSFFYVIDSIVPLIIETSENLSDDSYPRIKGLIYYSNSFSKSNFGYFLGNSIGSTKASYGQFIENLKIYDELYISDLGLFGTWVYFGVLSIIAIFISIFKVLKSSKKFNAFKYIAFHVLLGWTYFLFLPKSTFVFFISMLYLFDYKSIQNNIDIL